MSMRTARIILSLLIATTPALAYAASDTLMTIAQSVSSYIDSAVLLLIAFGIVVYFYGLMMNISSTEKGQQKRKDLYIWGIVVLFVMVSIWGIVALLKNTLFGDNTNSASAPSALVCTYDGIDLV